ncbi:MAG: 5'-nucleotidase [Polynucleobacter victoriensis]|uniref:5'-nucleotidase n=1 Tax=Polynucleobacter victoriensis TaxID=2049319 RepID=A0A212TEG0_9BURK|nr:5'-nucleotidase [Polynucleobacter victoriensis]SNC64412.1 5'-nucleotidase [Polynucleobacter victoriensis]
MAFSLDGKLVVAISSRALFNFEEENQIFEATDDSAYMQLQLERIDQAAKPGVAYPLVKKLLGFNQGKQQMVEVVILSRNDPVSGLRVFRSAKSVGLAIERGVFTRGRPPYHYLKSLQANLFLSANADDVRATLDAGFPAAMVFPQSKQIAESNPDEIRIAFDGDAVLFSDEAEQVFQSKGLDAFVAHESKKVEIPLPPGPFKPLLEALHRLQNATKQDNRPMRIRTALVTARSAPAHERAIRTLMAWGVTVDEAMFLGGLAKKDFLKEFQPDFFFDDQLGHCELASDVAPTGQVLSGIANQIKK